MRWLDGITYSMDTSLSPWVGPGKPNLPLGLRGKAGGGARVTAGPGGRRKGLGGRACGEVTAWQASSPQMKSSALGITSLFCHPLAQTPLLGTNDNHWLVLQIRRREGGLQISTLHASFSF